MKGPVRAYILFIHSFICYFIREQLNYVTNSTSPSWEANNYLGIQKMILYE
jgi:hypothetical protein